ncbi:MAG: hypothetical protein K6T66_14385 [Peptococcaceae bacterium]|nr:hypothetical protein [Peptococcaceae bacterium]
MAGQLRLRSLLGKRGKCNCTHSTHASRFASHNNSINAKAFFRFSCTQRRRIVNSRLATAA